MSADAGLDFSALARKDLLDIARYIARDNPQNARGFVIDLPSAMRLIVKTTGIGCRQNRLGGGFAYASLWAIFDFLFCD